MRGLIYYELKKIFKNKFFLLLLISFIVVDVYKIKCIATSQDIQVEGTEKIYDKIKGNVIDEKAQFLIENYNRLSEIVDTDNYSKEGNQKRTYTGYIFGDYSEFQYYYKEYKYIYDYEKNMENIISNAHENMNIYKKNNRYEYLRNKAIKKIYANRKIPKYYKTDNIKMLIEYDFSTLLMYLLVLSGIVGMIINEKKYKMFNIIETSSIGKKKNIRAKIISIIVFCFIVTVGIKIIDCISFSWMFNIEGWNQPLYSIEEYIYTPIKSNIITFFIFELIIYYIGLLFWGIITLLFSYIFLENVRSITFSMITFCIFILLCLNFKLYVNPIATFIPAKLFQEFETINLFGFPIFYYHVICVVLIIIILVISLYLIFDKKSLAVRG